jgi:hypothetical protein
LIAPVIGLKLNGSHATVVAANGNSKQNRQENGLKVRLIANPNASESKNHLGTLCVYRRSALMKQRFSLTCCACFIDVANLS